MPVEKIPSVHRIEESDESPSHRMQSQMRILPKPLPENIGLLSLIQKIPLLTGFLRNVNHTSRSLCNFIQQEAHLSDSLKQVASGFQIANVITTGIEFLRIPALFLIARIVGEKLPFTLSTQGRLLYSAATVGLGCMILAMPALLAPLAVSMASLGLTAAFYMMGKAFYERYQARKVLKEVEEQIVLETKELNEYIRQTIELEQRLKEVVSLKQKEILQLQLSEISDQFNALFAIKNSRLQELYDKKYRSEQILENLGTQAIIDRSVAIAVSTLMVIGLTIGFFFPPIGVIIVGVSGMLAGLYLLVRITPIIAGWVNQLLGHPPTIDSLDTPNKTVAPVLHPNVSNTLSVPEPSISPNHGSTTKTIVMLHKEDAVQVLQRQKDHIQSMDITQTILSNLVKKQELAGLLTFFITLSSALNSHTAEQHAQLLNHFFYSIEDPKRVGELLKQAFSKVCEGEIKLSNQDRQKLLSCQPLMNFLLECNIDPQLLHDKSLPTTNITHTIPPPGKSL